MHLLCNKCKHPLTNRSLRPSKDWVIVSRTTEIIDDGVGESFEYESIISGIQLGSFLIERDPRWLDPGEKFNFLISPIDVAENVVPPFKSGGGCCNWYYQPIHCPSCGTEVGIANLDCHQPKNITFPASKVIRSYRRIPA